MESYMCVTKGSGSCNTAYPISNKLWKASTKKVYLLLLIHKSCQLERNYSITTLLYMLKKHYSRNSLLLYRKNMIGLDFAIHMKDGKARDHGFLWRLDNRKNLLRLFKYVQEIF